MSTENDDTLDVVIRRSESSDSWGLNVGRRGSNGAFVVTGISENSPASRATLATGHSPLYEIKRGDDIIAIGALGSKLTKLDANTSKAEMRILFAGAGDAAVLRLRRGGGGKPVKKLHNKNVGDTKNNENTGWRRSWVNRARRSMSVDVRDLSRKVRDSITEFVVGGNENATFENERNPSEAVACSSRIFSCVGGEPLNALELLTSLEKSIQNKQNFKNETNSQQLFGHHDPLDDPANWKARILFLHVSPIPMDSRIQEILGAGRIVELGWDAAYGSQTPSLKLVCALGFCAAAWLALDDAAARTIVVICDAQGDRNRLGLASAACMRLASALLRSSLVQDLGPPIDASAEAYDLWLHRVATTETQRSLALNCLPPSFNRHLRHIDFAVEARRLPNARPLSLLGVSVRGLPLSDAPVLVVAAGGYQSIVWTSENCQQDTNVVDWDGDEAFYSIQSSNSQDCVLFGDFAIVLKFGGTYGASLQPNDPAAAIARYVANTAFLSDGAIDVLFTEIDFHPAYAPALAYSGKNDFKLRLAFRYAESQKNDDFFTLPSSIEAALDRGLRLVSKYHAVSADEKTCADLQALGVPKIEVAKLLTQLANNDIDKAFMLTNTLPRLPDALLHPSELAQLEKKYDDSFFTKEESKEQDHLSTPSQLLHQRTSEDIGDADELDARDFTIISKHIEEPHPIPVSRFGKRGVRKRHESLPPPGTAPTPPLEIRQANFLPPSVHMPEQASEQPIVASSVPGSSGLEQNNPTIQSQVGDDDELDARPEPTVMPSPAAAVVDNSASEKTKEIVSKPTVMPSPAAAVIDNSASEKTKEIVSTPSPVVDEKTTVDMSGLPASKSDSVIAPTPVVPSELAMTEAPKNEDKHSALSAMLSQRIPEKKIATASMNNKEAEAYNNDEYAGVPLREHPGMKEWTKLLKVGLPKGAVARKMMEEGVDPQLLEFDLKKPPPPEALAILNKTPNKEEAAALTGQRNWGKRAPNKKRQSLKPVHWEPLTKAEGTVWATAASNDVDDAERAELKRLFAVKQNAKVKKGGRSANAEPEACDAKRAANIAIGLKPLSEKFDGDLEKLVREGVAMDATRLSPENIEQLVAILPTDIELDETRRLFMNKENSAKRPAEQLFIVVATVADSMPGGLSDLRTRLTLFGDYLVADEAAKQIHIATEAVQEAANKAINSKALAEALQRLLTVGNALNEGTHRGGAAGFKLASLQRLAATKSQESGLSVIDFSVRKKFENDIRSLNDLGPLLKAARKINLNELRREVRRLKTTANSLKDIDYSSSTISLAAAEETANRASAVLDIAAERAVAAAKFFGEDVPHGSDPDLNAIFGSLADFLDAFLAAHAKHIQKEEERAAAVEQIAEKREQRSRQRSKKKISVDDILKDSASKKRSLVNKKKSGISPSSPTSLSTTDTSTPASPSS